MRFVLLLAVALCPGIAMAASFDCAKARSPLEHAVCNNLGLSAADDALANAYSAALKKLGPDGAGILRRAQTQWLRDLADQLKRNGVTAAQSAYHDRTEALQMLPDFPPPDQPVVSTIGYKNAPSGYDITLRLIAPADDDTSYIGPGQLVLHPSGRPDVLQVINIPVVFVNCSMSEAAAADTTENCGNEPLVDVEDYNFDGRQDIAVSNDEEGGYGAYGADVFLFDPAQKKFVYSPEISALTATLTFELDQEHKRISTGSKSGCCYHENTIYRLESNKPVPVSRHIEDADSDKQGRVKITNSTWAAGKWVDKVHYEKE